MNRSLGLGLMATFLGAVFCSCGEAQTPPPEAPTPMPAASQPVPASPPPRTETAVIPAEPKAPVAAEEAPAPEQGSAKAAAERGKKGRKPRKNVIDNASFDVPLIQMEEGEAAKNELRFSFRNLPAISADGSEVVLDDQAEDGARGNLNLRILVMAARTGRVTHEEVVLRVEEYDDIAYGDDPDSRRAIIEQVRKRVDKANAYLALKRWVPMDNVEIDYSREDRTEGDEGPPPQQVHVADTTITWNEPRLQVTGPGDKTVLGHEYREWVSKPRCLDPEGAQPKAPGCKKICKNPSFINQAAVDKDQHVLLLRIAYVGTDLCWEPDGAFHVVRLR